MSLRVYLYDTETLTCECGKKHQIKQDECFSQNITHNLGAMADEGGFYEALWRPEEVGITQAKQLIPILRKAIADMEDNPARFEKHNAPNGWGLYEHFLPWLRKYLEACLQYPEAVISVSR